MSCYINLFLMITSCFAVACQSARIFCWEHTILLAYFISGPTSVHYTFSCMDIQILSDLWCFYINVKHHLTQSIKNKIKIPEQNIHVDRLLIMTIGKRFFCSDLHYEFFCQVDTINLFTYAVLRLTPRALSSGVSSWSYLRKGSTASPVDTGSMLAHSASVSEQNFGSRDTAPVGNNNVARPLQQDRWSKGKDGFLVTDIWGAEAGSSTSATPTVWLQQTEERMYLCAYQYRSLTFILLVPVASILNGEQGVSVVKQQILENVSFIPVFTNIIFSLLNPLFILDLNSFLP